MGRRERKFFPSLSGNPKPDDRSSALTEAMPVVDDRLAVRILDLAVRIGEALLLSGASANEVTGTIVRVSAAYGLEPVHVNMTYNSITAAHHRSGAERPLTILRVVRGVVPDHERLLRLQALVVEIREGMRLADATERYREIRRTRFRYRPSVVIASQAFLAAGVAIMFGGQWLVITLAFVAAALAALTQFAFARAQIPYFFSQIAGAFVLTMVAALTPLLELTGLEAAFTVRPTVIVASGVVLMLAGLTVVGAAQDAIDGFALTAMGRILELITYTLGVVLGILAGLQTASVIGLAMAPPTEPLPLGPIPLQFLGAAIIAVAVAVYNGAGARIIVVSGVLSLVAWLVYLIAENLGFAAAAASGLGAFAGSFIGTLIAYRLHVPSVAITTAAILPMVPGAAVFRGLLSIVESGDSPELLLGGFTVLAAAATIGISLAVGASLGIYVGQPLRASLRGVTRARARLRR